MGVRKRRRSGRCTQLLRQPRAHPPPSRRIILEVRSRPGRTCAMQHCLCFDSYRRGVSLDREDNPIKSIGSSLGGYRSSRRPQMSQAAHRVPVGLAAAIFSERQAEPLDRLLATSRIIQSIFARSCRGPSPSPIRKLHRSRSAQGA